MPPSRRPLATFAFAAALAAVLGTIVSVTATLLAPRIADNRELERKTHVLVAAGLVELDAAPSRPQLESLYATRVVEKQVRVGAAVRPLFFISDGRGEPASLCIPLAGPGLWGPIHGYMAVAADGRRIVGVTFYEHRETPGLGDGIADPRWAAQWRGKSLVDDRGRLTPIRLRKGGVDSRDPGQSAHAVDAISGATITSRAVERLVGETLSDYQPLLEARWPSR